MSLSSLGLFDYIRDVSPVPAIWVSNNNISLKMNLQYKKVDKLWWNKDKNNWSYWEKRSLKTGGIYLPWALWSALRSLGADTLIDESSGFGQTINVGSFEGCFLIVDGKRIGFKRSRDSDYLLRLGFRNSTNILTPGATLEEKGEAMGFKLVKPRSYFINKESPRETNISDEEESEPDELLDLGGPDLFSENDEITSGESRGKFFFGDEADDNDEEDTFSLELEEGRDNRKAIDLLEMEKENSEKWIKADSILGCALLLGPLPIEDKNSTVGRRRDAGYLSEKGEINKAGLWRLAYTANQGIGLIDRLRMKRLSGVIEASDRHRRGERTKFGRLAPDRRRHLRLTQEVCLNLMDEGAIPLGIEYSAFSAWIAKQFHRFRGDALLVSDKGELIWVEIMRREMNRLNDRLAVKYNLLERDFLPLVADQIQAPVKYILKVPSGIQEKTIEPMKSNF